MLDTDPSMKDHHCSFLTIFENMETAVYENHSLIEFINDIMSYLYREKQVYYKQLCKILFTANTNNALYSQANRDDSYLEQRTQRKSRLNL